MELLLGLILLALDIWAVVNVWGSNSSVPAKILWTLGIVILPLIGFIVWLLAGPRGRTTAIA